MSLLLNNKIFKLIRGVLTNSSDEDVSLIVNHLVSREIGVTKLSELSEVTLDILPPSLKIPWIKGKQLLEAFASCASSGESLGVGQLLSTPSTSSAHRTNERVPLGSIQNVLPDRSVFTFTVPWGQMPKETIDNLNKAKEQKVKANPKDLDNLKLAIAKKLQSAYESHKDIYAGQQKYPGRKIYKNVADQVEAKFGDSVKTIVKGVIMQSGTSNFCRVFETCIENFMRSSKTGFPKSKVMKGKKVVGVDLDAYDPIMTSDAKNVQQGIKEHLQNLIYLGTEERDWPNIVKNLRETYELQRADILLGTAEVKSGDAGHEHAEEEENLLKERALEKLKREWPFLFEMKGIELHHKTLTKRDLGIKLKVFIEQHLDLTLNFLTTSSKCNVDNLIIRLQVEAKQDNSIEPESKFLLMLHMLANHFGENFSSLYIPAEKTCQPAAFPHSILEEKKEPCIVALDNDIYAARKYHACADQVALIEVDNPKDAFLALIKMCFVFDLEYPPELPLAMEFVERYILDMGIVDTKIKRKGRQIVVLSEIVKKFITNFETFSAEVQQRLG